LVVGAGDRGRGYATYAREHSDLAKVVGVAEPREFYRNDMAQTYDIAPENVFTVWRQAARRDKLADAVIVATQDAMHADPAVAFAAKGYHMLLEKPMAPTEPDRQRNPHQATRQSAQPSAFSAHVPRGRSPGSSRHDPFLPGPAIQGAHLVLILGDVYRLGVNGPLQIEHQRIECIYGGP